MKRHYYDPSTGYMLCSHDLRRSDWTMKSSEVTCKRCLRKLADKEKA